MKKKLDKVLVVDVESTCWLGTPPIGEESEIIEVGLCLLDVASGERESKRSIFVRPQHSTVSSFCTELTTITQQQVAQGVTFTRACEILRGEYASADRVWASYGDYDRRQFIHQCRARGVPYPFSRTHINVKSLFALALALPHELNLLAASKHVGWDLEGTHHRGDDDAWNIARLLGLILGRARATQTDSVPIEEA